jgi:hypothetical protein
MLCLQEIYGEHRIFGDQWPMEPSSVELVRAEGETDAAYQWRQYVSNLIGEHADNNWGAKRDKTRELNPNGFWESIFVSRGLRRGPRTYALVDTLESKGHSTFVKVVAQGLSASDPAMIKGVIYLLRDPRAIAHSQRNLFREWKVFDPCDMRMLDIMRDEVVKSTRSYIESTLKAAQWFSRNSHIPVLFVDSDKLISDPRSTFETIGTFLGERGDVGKVEALIDQSLVRSVVDDEEVDADPHTADAMELHGLFVRQDWGAIEAFASDPRRRINRESRSWLCARAAHPVNEFICRDCISGRSVTTTLDLMGRARVQGIEWETRPCAYLCAYNLDGELLSMAETIANNHWRDYDKRVENYLRTGGVR